MYNEKTFNESYRRNYEKFFKNENIMKEITL